MMTLRPCLGARALFRHLAWGTRSVGAMAGVVVLLNSLILCSCSRSSGPQPVVYSVYLGATGYKTEDAASRYDLVFVFDAESLTLRDSIPAPGAVLEMAVSPDGHWLYAQCQGPGGVPGALYKINTTTKVVAWSLDGDAGPIALFSNGELLTRQLLEGTDIVDANTGNVISRLPATVRILGGPPNGTKAAAIVNDSTAPFRRDTIVTVCDIASGETYGRYVPRLENGEAPVDIYCGCLHRDGQRVGVIGLGGGCWFMIGDVETGETTFRHRLTRPFGELAVSNDGSTAVVTDPGAPWYGEGGGPPSVFDLQQNRLLKTLDETSGLDIQAPSQVRFLPDDSRIVIAPYVFWGGTAAVFAADRGTLSGGRTTQPHPEELLCGALAVGRRP
jgi:hypothetical protein